MHVPGHTPWCLLAYELHRSLAFTGDFLLKEISSNPIIQNPSLVPPGYKSLKVYIASLKKVRDMGFETAFPGHGEIIDNPHERISNLLDFISERKLLMADILAEGTQTPYQMVEKLFPGLPMDEVFLAVSEVMGYMELFEEEGKAVRREDALLYFSPAQP